MDAPDPDSSATLKIRVRFPRAWHPADWLFDFEQDGFVFTMRPVGISRERFQLIAPKEDVQTGVILGREAEALVKNMPPGDWKVRLWNPAASVSRTVRVSPEQIATVSFGR